MLKFIEIAEIYNNTGIKNGMFENLVAPRTQAHFDCAIEFFKGKKFQTKEEVLLYLAYNV